MNRGALLFPNGQPVEKNSFILFYLIICSFLYPIPTIVVLIFYLCNEFALERDPTCFIYTGIYNLILATATAIKFTGDLIFVSSDPETRDLIVIYCFAYVILISLHLWGVFLSFEFYKLIKNPTVDPRINPLIPNDYNRPPPYHNGGYEPYRPPLPTPNHAGGYEPHRPPQTGGSPFSGQNNVAPQTGGSPFSGQNNVAPQTGGSPFSGQNNVAPQTGGTPFSVQNQNNDYAPKNGGTSFGGLN